MAQLGVVGGSRDDYRLKLSNTHMEKSLTSRSAVTIAFVCLLSGLLPVACSRNPESDTALQQRLVGTWRYSRSDGNSAIVHSDLAFTVTPNGSYISRITSPQAHTLEGTAEVKNGFLIVTITNRDNSQVPSPIVSRETIVQFDKGELVTQSEGSSVTNVFRKDVQ